MTAKPTVVLTRRWPAAVEQHLSERYTLHTNTDDSPFTSAEMAQALANADAVCPTVTDQLPAELFKQPVRAKLIANFGVGFNHIALAAAQSQGLTITNTPDVLTDCTADLAILLMLMVARRAGEGERELRNGRWSGWRPTHLMGQKLSGKTLGIVGLGRIGLAVAHRAHFGFGMRVLYHNRNPVIAPSGLPLEFVPDLHEMLGRSQVVSLHCPATEATARLLNADAFAALPSDAIVVNTARGEVIDEQALISALDGGALLGAGLDVYAGEPHVNPLLLERNDVVLLPHLGSATTQTREAMGMRVAENLAAFFQGERVPDAL